jgi:hypothetical protein
MPLLVHSSQGRWDEHFLLASLQFVQADMRGAVVGGLAGALISANLLTFKEEGKGEMRSSRRALREVSGCPRTFCLVHFEMEMRVKIRISFMGFSDFLYHEGEITCFGARILQAIAP